MAYYVFAEKGLMLDQASGGIVRSDTDVKFVEYEIFRTGGTVTRINQGLQVLLRPVSLKLCTYLQRSLVKHLVLPLDTMRLQSCDAGPKDTVVFFNPRPSALAFLQDLKRRTRNVVSYFFDPVSRLGWSAATLEELRRVSSVLTYSPSDATHSGLAFTLPFIPAIPSTRSPAIYDIVYVGSPTPGRLMWILYLNLCLVRERRRGYVRLASRSRWPVRVFPWLFCAYIPFEEYVGLCQVSRGLVELHERDADGVTTRAMLAAALGIAHLCNRQTFPGTLKISPIWGGTLGDFLRNHRQVQANDPIVGTFGTWIRKLADGRP